MFASVTAFAPAFRAVVHTAARGAYFDPVMVAGCWCVGLMFFAHAFPF